MKDKSASLKVGDKYKSMISLKQGKYGMQLAFSPDFQKVLYEWIKSQDGKWLNMNIKEFEPRGNAQPNTSAATSSDESDCPF